MTRLHNYPIIRFLVGSFYTLAFAILICGLLAGGYLYFRAEAMSAGTILGGPLSGALNIYDPPELCLAAAFVTGGGMIGFLVFGAVGQVLAMQRDRAICAAEQVDLLEEILEQNELATSSIDGPKVELCDGCGRLGSLRRIDSGQWVCRDCRRNQRSA